MRTLSRYVVRAHVGPFIFAFSAVTGLLFLNAVAQRLEDLVGRGLELSIMFEFMMLSLPHIVALTFPMSILVAVLYAFSDMTGSNEVMALAAGGVHPIRMLTPLLGIGLVLTGTMLYFNDRVLPESNHRLSSLLSDVGSTNPTFDLREEVINEVPTDDDTRYFLRARTIDPTTNRLTDVEIYDLSRVGETRTIIAARGEMALTPNGEDLYLTLEDGVAFSTNEQRPGGFQRLYFQQQVIPFRGVRAQIERRVGGGARGAREMTIPMLRERVASAIQNTHSSADEMRVHSEYALEEALKSPENPDARRFAEDEVGSFSDRLVLEAASNAQATHSRWDLQRRDVYRHQVEIYKKHAIAAACLIFILLGLPLAIRYPQGGVGMVIATSVVIFFLYYVGLIVGERFANRGQVHPWLAMWAPNIILLVPALYMLTRVGHNVGTNRGSRWDEIRYRFGAFLGRVLGRGSDPGSASAGEPVADGGVG